MMVVDVARAVDRSQWDERVHTWMGGTIFQSTYWAAYCTDYYGTQPYYLTVRDGVAVIGQLLLHEILKGQESFPGGVRSPYLKFAKPLLKIFIWWGGGPLVRDLSQRPKILEACLSKINVLAAEQGVIGIKEVYLPSTTPVSEEECAALSRYGYETSQRATVHIDVQRSLEELWDGLKKDVARTPVRQAQKHGVQLRQVEKAEELSVFCRLVSTWRHERGFPPYGFDRYEKMWTHLRPHCSFFLAQHDTEYIGGLGIFHFNKRAHLFTPVHSHDSRRLKIYAGDFLYWEMIRWCHEQGFEVFDLSGTFVSPRSTKEDGIRRFKGKWGGQVVEYPVFTRVTKPGRWAFASFAGKTGQKIWTLVSKQ